MASQHMPVLIAGTLYGYAVMQSMTMDCFYLWFCEAHLQTFTDKDAALAALSTVRQENAQAEEMALALVAQILK